MTTSLLDAMHNLKFLERHWQGSSMQGLENAQLHDGKIRRLGCCQTIASTFKPANDIERLRTIRKAILRSRRTIHKHVEEKAKTSTTAVEASNAFATLKTINKFVVSSELFFDEKQPHVKPLDIGQKELKTDIFEEKKSRPLIHLPNFSKIFSNRLAQFKLSHPPSKKALLREDFLADRKYKNDPPVIATCNWVPDKLIKHLMRNKRGKAIGTKWLGNAVLYDRSKSSYKLDCITNMEGAMHTFFTPLVKAKLTHDFLYMGSKSPVFPFNRKGRPVILSAAIQPDMEKGEPENAVIFKICQIGNLRVKGKPLNKDFEILTPRQKQHKETRDRYDELLRAHMIHHLTKDHRLPSLQEVKMTTLEEIESCMSGSQTDFRGQAVEIAGRVLSLEVLYNLYKIQLENELLALEQLCPQGYVYSISPPNIFLSAIGGSTNGKFLNRLQALAMKELSAKIPLKNMKLVCFAHFSDPKGLEFYRSALKTTGINVIKTHPLNEHEDGPFAFDPKARPMYLINRRWAFVIHNNSDGFGQNIQFEGLTSADGYVGSYSDAAIALLRERADLCDYIINPRFGTVLGG